MDTLLLVGGSEREGNIISQLVRLRELTQPRARRVNAQQRTSYTHSGAHDIFSVSDLAFDIRQRQRRMQEFYNQRRISTTFGLLEPLAWRIVAVTCNRKFSFFSPLSHRSIIEMGLTVIGGF